MTFPILTVCSYNRARSVMAELLLARAAAGMDIAVSGAGFNSEGEPPLPATIAALRRYDLDAIEPQHEAFVAEGTVACSPELRRALGAARSPAA